MPERVERVWETSGADPRGERPPFRYTAFVPDPIGGWDEPLSGRTADAVASTTAALADLDAAGSGQDLDVLAAPLLRAEAIGSSLVEGLRASNQRLAVALYDPPAADGMARTLLASVRAMERTGELAATRTRLSTDDLFDIHRVLLAGSSEERVAGVARSHQSWLGGRGLSPADATFVPPPEDRVPGLLEDLVAFMNLDRLPAIVQAAIAHAQFETIHPFGDGNGRAGRCLIHLVLRRRGFTRFVPPISMALAGMGARYPAGFTAFQEGRTDQWISEFAGAAGTAAGAARRLWARTAELLAGLTERAGSPAPGSLAREIIMHLPAAPVVSADTVASRCGVSPAVARDALQGLQDAGVLGPVRIGRRRESAWVSGELFEVLDGFED